MNTHASSTRVVSTLVALLLLASCGASSDSSQAATPTSTATAVEPTVPPVTTTTDEDATQTSPTTAPTPVVESPAEPLLEGVPLLQIITPTAAVGIRPLLEWETIEGAATYRAVVLDADGNIAWAWIGDGISIPYGGAEFPADYGDGPMVTTGSTWSVVALDSQREVIAISERRELEP